MTEVVMLSSDEVFLDNVVIGKWRTYVHARAGLEYDSGYPVIHLLDYSKVENVEEAVINSLCHKTLHFVLRKFGMDPTQVPEKMSLWCMMPSLDKLHAIWVPVGLERGVETNTDLTGMPNFLVNYRLVNLKYGQQAFWASVDRLCDDLEGLFRGREFEEGYLRALAERYFRLRAYLPKYIRKEARDCGLDES